MMMIPRTSTLLSLARAARAAVLTTAVVVAPLVLPQAVAVANPAVTEPGETTLLPGQRIEMGTVIEVLPGQIAVASQHLRPRYLPRKAGIDLETGDRINMILNAGNAVVDYFPAMAKRPAYRVVEGQIAVPLAVGHEHAVIDTAQGETQAFRVQSGARSKIASIPVGVEAVFLIDDGTILDANFAGEKAVERAEEKPQKKSPIKGVHRQVPGTLVEPAASGQVTIRTLAENDERTYEVRSYVMNKLIELKQGQDVILLVDSEDKVVGVAIPPARAG